MLYVNAKTLNMDHKWDSERAILMWNTQSLRELESCKYFLTDTKMENGRQIVIKFAMSSLDMPLLNDKLDYVFEDMKCVANLTLHWIRSEKH